MTTNIEKRLRILETVAADREAAGTSPFCLADGTPLPLVVDEDAWAGEAAKYTQKLLTREAALMQSPQRVG
jgi:hypothetical protein